MNERLKSIVIALFVVVGLVLCLLVGIAIGMNNRFNVPTVAPTATVMEELPPTWTDVPTEVPTNTPYPTSTSKPTVTRSNCYTVAEWSAIIENVGNYNVSFGDGSEYGWEHAWVYMNDMPDGMYAAVYNGPRNCVERAGVFGVIDPAYADGKTAGQLFGSVTGYFAQGDELLWDWFADNIDECVIYDVEDVNYDREGKGWYFSCEESGGTLSISLGVQIDMGE